VVSAILPSHSLAKGVKFFYAFLGKRQNFNFTGMQKELQSACRRAVTNMKLFTLLSKLSTLENKELRSLETEKYSTLTH
jgi:hypothetical protein